MEQSIKLCKKAEDSRIRLFLANVFDRMTLLSVQTIVVTLGLIASFLMNYFELAL